MTIEHGLHTFGQGTVGHSVDRLQGLLVQLEKRGWKVKLKPVSDYEMIRIIICEHLVYRNDDFLKLADFNTDGVLDPVVKEAVEELEKATEIMEL